MVAARSVPFFNYPALFKAKEREIMAVIHDVLSRGAYIMQKDLKEFEDNLAKFLGCKHVIGVADCTEAITLSMIAIGLKAGDEVILPSHTMVATAGAVHLLGAKPVLVDCGEDHLIDPKSAEKAVTSKTRVIMPVQLNGRTANMDPISALAKKHNLQIVEDSAQALGSHYKGKMAGTFGATGNFSFYPAKLLGCFGDGGAVSTNDDKIADTIFELRDHGRSPKDGEVKRWGLNSRLDNLQAAVLNFNLKTFKQDIARRRELAKMYDERLREVKQLRLPPPPDSNKDHFDVYQNYEIEAENRDELKKHLEDKGVKTLIQWGGKAIHQFKALGFGDVYLPYTETMFTRCMMLPMNVSLSNDDVEYVSEEVRSFFRKS